MKLKHWQASWIKTWHVFPFALFCFFVFFACIYHMVSFFQILMLDVFQCTDFLFPITFSHTSYISNTSAPPAFISFSSIFFMPLSLLSHVPLSQASSMKVSFYCVRHICIAVPRGKQWLEERRCVWIAWDGEVEEKENENKEIWLVICQNNGWLSDRKTSLHASVGILYQLCFIFIFLPLTGKHAHLNVQKSNTNTTICTSKCCHREITERVIHPYPPSLWASLLLMASSFFLCSLYFPSDSGACFIVFCHVSVIAPTACLMLSV